MRVVVLCGGESSERDVSQASGWAVARALAGYHHNVALVDPAAEDPVLADPLPTGDQKAVLVPKTPPSLDGRAELRRRMYAALTTGRVHQMLREADLVFIALHGGWGEDGHVQALLEMAGIPFTGAGSELCSITWHKGRCQGLLAAAGVPVPQRVQYRPSGQPVPGEVELLVKAGPVVVKPVADGSSVAVRLVETLDDLRSAAEEAGDEVLVEPFLPGREFTVAVLGDSVLPVVEIELTTAVFDYEAKYQPGAVREVCPAPIPDDLASKMQQLARLAHRVLGFTSTTYSRVDFRCDSQGEPYCLEVNALPGLTRGSLVPVAAAGAGLTYPELVNRLLQLSQGN